jgi:hypothetical protein
MSTIPFMPAIPFHYDVSFVRHATTFLDESESQTEGW